MAGKEGTWRRICPSCERPVGSGAGVCPYCEEPIPGTARARLRFHAPYMAFAVLSVPYAVWGGAALSALPFAALLLHAAWECRRSRIGKIGFALGVALAAAVLLDPVLRYDAAMLWRGPGVALGLLFAALSAFLRDPLGQGVASDVPRLRIREKLLPAAMDIALAGTAAVCLLG